MVVQIVYKRWSELKKGNNYRKSDDPITFARIEADILKNGIKQPLYIRPDGEVVTGRTRHAIAVKHELDSVPCIEIDRGLTEEEVLMEQVQENECRGNATTIETAAAYHRLLALNGGKKDVLARKLGQRNASDICKKIKILDDLVPELHRFVHKEIPFTSAYAIAQLKDAATQVEVAQRVVNGELNRDEAVSECRRILGKRKGNSKPTKIRLPNGTTVIVPAGADMDKFGGDLNVLEAAKKKALQKGSPPSAIPSLMRSG